MEQPANMRRGPKRQNGVQTFVFLLVCQVLWLSPLRAALPSPWAEQDIGSTGAAGSGDYDSGEWTVVGAGADIWGTADKFHFVYRSWTGDGELIARVTSQEAIDDWSKAGIMIRETLDGDSRYALLAVTPANGVTYQQRQETGSGVSSVTLPSAEAPYWLRLTRQGNVFRAYASASGSEWILLSERIISMTEEVCVGLAVTSHSHGVLGEALFTNVSIDGEVPVDDGSGDPWIPGMVEEIWKYRDLGTAYPYGEVEYDGESDTFSITASGAPLGGNFDSGFLVYKQFSGDGEIVARINSVEDADDYSSAGIMFREDIQSDSPHASILLRDSIGVRSASRAARTAGTSNFELEGWSPPSWLKLERRGAQIKSYISSDGSSWTLVKTWSVAMPESLLVGLAASANSNGLTSLSEIDQVAVSSPLVQDVFIGQQVGGGLLGSAVYDEEEEEWTILGSGTGLENEADEFYYVYRAVEGDVQITAHVVSQTDTHDWAKAGVMLRKTMHGGSPFGLMAITPEIGYRYQTRAAQGATMVEKGNAAGAAPAWVRLKKIGSNVTAYYSSDGTNWTAVAAQSIDFGEVFYAGLAVSSMDNGLLSTAVFDQVEVELLDAGIVDTDGDGLDDGWEMTHFGDLDENENGDPDADGFSNFEEYLAGTDPLDDGAYPNEVADSTSQVGLKVYTPLSN